MRTKERIVPLNADARRALRAYLEARPAAADDHLFIEQRGTGLTASSAHDLVVKYARQASVEATPDTLRHILARSVLDAGAALVDVATILIHHRLDTRPGSIFSLPSTTWSGLSSA